MPMRRKSARNAGKSSPEKHKKVDSPKRKSRRQSRRRKRSTSESSEESAEDLNTTPEVKIPEGTNADKSPEEPVWKVTSSNTPGEIQKLKISLTKPTSLTPERTPEKVGHRHRDRSGNSYVSDTESSTVSDEYYSGRSKQSAKAEEAEEDEKNTQVEDKKGKGKSKGKHKSKHEQKSQFGEPEIEKKSEISENVQVTPESPTIDIPVDNDVTIGNEGTHFEISNNAKDQEEPPKENAVTETVQGDRMGHGKTEETQLIVSQEECAILYVQNSELSKNSVPAVIEEEKVERLMGQEVESENSIIKTPEDTEIEAAVKSIEPDILDESRETPINMKNAEEPETENPEEPQVVAENLQPENGSEDPELPKPAKEETNSGQLQAEDCVTEIEDKHSRSRFNSECSTSEQKEESMEQMDVDVSESEHFKRIGEKLQNEDKNIGRKFKLKSAPSEDVPILRKRSWGKSLAGLKSVKSSLIKVDFQSLRNMFPKLNMLDESEVKLESVQPRERIKSSSYEGKSLLEGRKVSIEDPEKPLYKSQSSVNSSKSDEGFNTEENDNIIALNRKISIVDDSVSKMKSPPSPAKNPISDVLFITNLVRPFTLKQLKGLLERTGKIKEQGFWTDRIKSKCYIQYESADEAEATRNALHGVQWPIGNGKKLVIDYGTAEDLEKARNPPPPPPAPVVEEPKIPNKENEVPPVKKSRTEERGAKEKESRRKETHVREWDLGKNDLHKKRSRSRSRDRHERKRHSRRTPSPLDDFFSRKHKKLEEAVPQKLMDDLFQKTKASPSIYWQPLTPEEIATKQQQRLMRMAEHKRRMEETSRSRSDKTHDFGRGAPYKRRYD